MPGKNLFGCIEEHEGIRLKAYRDTKGFLTIGIGRNLDSNGISQSEAEFMLQNDINSACHQLTPLAWYQALDSVRQEAIIELCFNMGFDSLMEFKRMIAALVKHDFKTAAQELLDSKWTTDVGSNRSSNVAYRLQFGKY